MAVYVDSASIPFGRMVMSHMWADTDDELLAMARKIGVQTKWIQGHQTLSFGKHRKASWVHFDVCSTKRKAAIHHGAKETDKYGPVEHTARIKMKSEDPVIREAGARMLDRVADCRRRAEAVELVLATSKST